MDKAIEELELPKKKTVRGEMRIPTKWTKSLPAMCAGLADLSRDPDVRHRVWTRNWKQPTEATPPLQTTNQIVDRRLSVHGPDVETPNGSTKRTTAEKPCTTPATPRLTRRADVPYCEVGRNVHIETELTGTPEVECIDIPKRTGASGTYGT